MTSSKGLGATFFAAWLTIASPWGVAACGSNDDGSGGGDCGDLSACCSTLSGPMGQTCESTVMTPGITDAVCGTVLEAYRGNGLCGGSGGGGGDLGDAGGVTSCGGYGQACCTLSPEPCQVGSCCDPDTRMCVGFAEPCAASGTVCSDSACQPCGQPGEACCSLSDNACGQGCCDPEGATPNVIGACVKLDHACEPTSDGDMSICAKQGYSPNCTVCGLDDTPCCEGGECAATLTCRSGTCQPIYRRRSRVPTVQAWVGLGGVGAYGSF